MRDTLVRFGLLMIGMLLPVHVFSQAYDGDPCSLYSNSALKTYIQKGTVPLLEVFSRSYISTYESWATSSLRPDTKKPAAKKPGEEDYEFTERVHRWTCMYTPFSARDGDTGTAWVEGRKDDGIGEILIVKIDIATPIEIWAGIGASPELFKANNRPRKVRVYVLAGTGTEAMPGVQYSHMQYKNIKVIARQELELKDRNGYQPLQIPAAALPEGVNATFIAIEILSVYKGTTFSDTGISEIMDRQHH